MTDRDTFAAAALTGLLARPQGRQAEELAAAAYRVADEMLLRRGMADRDNCVAGNQPEIPCHVTKPMPVFIDGRGSVTPVSYAENDEKRVDWHTSGATLTDAEREAVEQAIDALNGVEDMSAGACSRADAAADTLRGLLERLK